MASQFVSRCAVEGTPVFRYGGQALQESCPERLRAAGKFLFRNGDKLRIQGVTYGTFRPDESGCEYHDPGRVRADFSKMSAYGINAVRVYTVPPRWVLDLAGEFGLRVMVGLPWEQHVAFLEHSATAASIRRRVRQGVRACASHPAVFCYAVGNEIPASIVRWHGARRIERFIEGLYAAAKEEDPGGLVTYVNFPSTEYLELPFLDLVTFNVYLETERKLESYLARLQNLANERPLILAEVGLDSRRNGETRQAQSLDWHIRTAFREGCAGLFLFSWSDEWHRGGFDIEDWDFGLVTRAGSPKPALQSVSAAFREVPFGDGQPWPFISVVVCSCNGARTIRDTCEALRRLTYPRFEVIVVDDGSTDETASIVKSYPFRLISTRRQGLSGARNTGMRAARGEIVAYTDDDAYPDVEWLHFLADTFQRSPHAAVGGPNIAPMGDGPIAECVANAPGGPVHVLLSDREAEHIPGCNMAFRKSVLEEVGGFDPRFRAAGDDVDLCWRLQERGHTIGFNPAAVVWHHRRNSLRAYWRQQQGYGKAEALLEEKWPEKYNNAGHLRWAGRLYGKGLTQHLGRVRRIYHGAWGGALFQSVYEDAPKTIQALPLMPEWYLVIAALAGLSAVGVLWEPMVWFVPLLAAAAAALAGEALLSSLHAQPPRDAHGFYRVRFRVLTMLLHLLQPLARLLGRLRYGLSPWRWRSEERVWFARGSESTLWSESWRSAPDWIGSLEERLRLRGAVVLRGGDYDRWDLEVRGGGLGRMRALLAVEEHGAGRQWIRLRMRPLPTMLSASLAAGLFFLSLLALLDDAFLAAGVLAAPALLVTAGSSMQCASAAAALQQAFQQMQDKSPAAARRMETPESVRESNEPAGDAPAPVPAREVSGVPEASGWPQAAGLRGDAAEDSAWGRGADEQK